MKILTVEKIKMKKKEAGNGTLKTQRTLTYFVRGSITVRLNSCLAGLDSTKQVTSTQQSHWIQTSQTVGQPYSDISPYKRKWYSLHKISKRKCPIEKKKNEFADTELPEKKSKKGHVQKHRNM